MRIAAAIAVLVLAFGCGSDDDTESAADDPRATVERYLQALKEGDAADACAVIELDRANVSRTRCEQAFDRALQEDRISVPDDIDDSIGAVVEDESGSARVENTSTGGYWDLVKRGGQWRLQVAR